MRPETIFIKTIPHCCRVTSEKASGCISGCLHFGVEEPELSTCNQSWCSNSKSFRYSFELLEMSPPMLHRTSETENPSVNNICPESEIDCLPLFKVPVFSHLPGLIQCYRFFFFFYDHLQVFSMLYVWWFCELFHSAGDQHSAASSPIQTLDSYL